MSEYKQAIWPSLRVGGIASALMIMTWLTFSSEPLTTFAPKTIGVGSGITVGIYALQSIRIAVRNARELDTRRR